jgi:hypothetical protein
MLAALAGLVVWLVTMADAPRYSHGMNQNLGNPALFPILLGLAIVGGYTVRRRAWIVGVMLGIPGLVLSPWTAPRGDNDGLWLLIVPFMAAFCIVLVLGARLGAKARTRWSSPNR